MRTWSSFWLLMAYGGVLAVLSWSPGDEGEGWHRTAIAGSTFLLGALPWILTRRAVWVGTANESTEGAPTLLYLPGVLRWYRNGMVCALMFGGLVFWCATDHNAMYESCMPTVTGGSAEGKIPNWITNGTPCRLTPSSYFDLALGTSFALALFQFPIVLYWMAKNVAHWVIRNKKGHG